MRKNWLLIAVGLLVAVLAIGTIACDGDGDDDAEEEVTVVSVRLAEWQVIPDVDSVSAGRIRFNVSNIGGTDHELVIIRTDLAPDALPTNDDGSVDEEGAGIEVIGKVAEFAPGGEDSITQGVPSGAYVLICNVVENGGNVHYDLGMRTAFDVTE